MSLLEVVSLGAFVPLISLFSQADPLAEFPRITEFFPWLLQVSLKWLIFYAFCLLGLVFFVKNLYVTLHYWILSKYTAMLSRNLRSRLLGLYLQQDYLFYTQSEVGEISQNINVEFQRVQNTIVTLIHMMSDIGLTLGLCGFMLYYEPFGTIFAILLILLTSYVYFLLFGGKVKSWSTARLDQDTKAMRFFSLFFQSVKDMLVYGIRQDMRRHIDRYIFVARHMEQRQNFVNSLPRVFLELVGVASLAILVLSMLLANKTLNEIIIVLGLYTIVAFKLFPVAIRMVSQLQLVRSNLVVIQRLAELKEQLEGKIKTVGISAEKLQFRNSIVFRDVSFSYPQAEQDSLKNLSCRINQGEMIGIIGASGSGKTSFVDAVAGLIAPKSGSIEVDGVNIQDNLQAWQQAIGYVTQSTQIFYGSILENISLNFASQDYDLKKLWGALEQTQMKAFVESLPHGIDTQLGDKGAKLSGGQRQRIGIARALYRDAQLLVFDESTNALDSKTEQQLLKAIQALKPHKTLLFITHNTSALGQCDRVFRFENGELSEEKNI